MLAIWNLVRACLRDASGKYNAEIEEGAAALEEAQGLIVKLTAQVNHNYENSSLPSSKCIDRKKITNNREKSGKKPGASQGMPTIRGSPWSRTGLWR